MNSSRSVSNSKASKNGCHFGRMLDGKGESKLEDEDNEKYMDMSCLHVFVVRHIRHVCCCHLLSALKKNGFDC